MTAFAALLLVAPPPSPPPVWLVEAIEQFSSACIDGTLRTNAPQREIQRAELPSELRGRFRSSLAGRYFRLGERQPSYLIQVASNDPSSEYSSICGLAVPGRRRLFTMFANGMRLEPQASRVFGQNYTLNAVMVGGYVVLDISHHAAGGAQSTPQHR